MLMPNRMGWLVCAAIVLPAAARAQAQPTEIVLHYFGSSPPNGGAPNGVIRDSSGNLYGTASDGGFWDLGVVFKVDPSGQETVLYNFEGASAGGTDGAGPNGPLVRDADGNLYGTTVGGGAAYNFGTVFELDTAGNETILYSFTGDSNGGRPAGSLIRDSAGNLYGATTDGGTEGAGTLFKLDTAGKLTVLYNFPGGEYAGTPNPGLVRDTAGNFYGTAAGGTTGGGVIFKVTPDGGGEVLYNFTYLYGVAPRWGVTLDTKGNLYGTTSYAGYAEYGCVYKLDASNQFTVLHNFSRKEGGGYAGVIVDPSGAVYGNTPNVIYEIEPGGNYKQLYTFGPKAKGAGALAGIIRDSSGNFYGTTQSGGVGNQGAVYELDPAGQYSVLFGFPDPNPTTSDNPTASVISDSAGNLYGTTYGTAFVGGTYYYGTVYKLDATGHETVLYAFTGGTDGAYPWAGVVRDASGNLYGTATQGGSAANGVIYKIDTSGQYAVLYNFTGGVDGGEPYAGLALDSSGNLYGTTTSGGAANAGVVFKVDPNGNETVLYSFTGGDDGGSPAYGSLLLGASGDIYGTTFGGGGANVGTVYKVDASGNESVLYSFAGGTDGAYPYGLTVDAQGNFYGVAEEGGADNYGVVFKLDTHRRESALYTFTGGVDGGYPIGSILHGEGGDLYGATINGGTSNFGVVFMVDAGGQETVLHSFTGGMDGAYPNAGVIRTAAGNLYGTTNAGGKRSGGMVFGLKTQ